MYSAWISLCELSAYSPGLKKIVFYILVIKSDGKIIIKVSLHLEAQHFFLINCARKRLSIRIILSDMLLFSDQTSIHTTYLPSTYILPKTVCQEFRDT